MPPGFHYNLSIERKVARRYACSLYKYVSRRRGTPVVHLLEALEEIFSRSGGLILGRPVGRDTARYGLDG